MTVDQTINSWVAPIADWLSAVVFYAVPIGDTKLPLILVWLIMGGVVCTLAFRFVNLRGFRHSARVIRGDYSSKDHPGEATPFQACFDEYGRSVVSSSDEKPLASEPSTRDSANRLPMWLESEQSLLHR